MYTYIFFFKKIIKLPYEDSITEHFNGDHPGSLEILSFFCCILYFNDTSLGFLTLSSSEMDHIKLFNMYSKHSMKNTFVYLYTFLYYLLTIYY